MGLHDRHYYKTPSRSRRGEGVGLAVAWARLREAGARVGGLLAGWLRFGSKPGSTERRPKLGRTAAAEAEEDRILGKIGASGMASLTDEERRFLHTASQRRRGS